MMGSKPSSSLSAVEAPEFIHAGRAAIVLTLVRLACFILCLTAAWVCLAASDEAVELYWKAQQAEHKGDIVRAYVFYTQAAALDPHNWTYWMRSQALRAPALLQAKKNLPVAGQPPKPLTPEEAAVTGAVSPKDLQEAREALPPPLLHPSGGARSFDLNGDARMVFEKVADAFGLQVIFDSDYQPPPPFQFRVTGLSFHVALRALEDVSNSFVVPAGEKIMLVARDTPQKRRDLMLTVAEALPIPQRMSAQEAQEITTLVQQILDIRRITVDPQKRLIFLRDQARTAIVARQLLEQLLHYRPQVSLEADLISVSDTASRSLGLNLPNSFTLANAGSRAIALSGGVASFFGLGVASAQMLATFSQSHGATLLRAQMLALDGQPAELHVGDRYPVISVGYYGNTNGATGQVFSPPPTVNFEDLGLVLKVTPTVHSLEEVTLDVDAQFKLLGTGSLNGIPVISARQFQGKVRLNTGQWAVVAGLMTASEAKTISGIAGLSSVPYLGALVRQNTLEKDSSTTLLVLKPHIASLPPGAFATRSIWIGSESHPLGAY